MDFQFARLSLAALASALFTLSAWGFGHPGHEAVGHIAEKYLEPKVKKQIFEILREASLAEASVWPDRVKYVAAWAHTRPYHYVSVPDKITYQDALKKMSPEEIAAGDAIRALLKAEDILMNPNTHPVGKAYALRFMVHMVGDVHQPLHVGRVEDRGGNEIEMLWYGRKTNLHAIWDFQLINDFLNTLGVRPGRPRDGALYAKNLRKPRAKEVAEWQESYLSTWMNESIKLREQVYKNRHRKSEFYYAQNIPVTHERVLQAGVRLGGWLNAIFNGQRLAPTESNEFRESIKAVLGPKYLDVISYYRNNDAKITLSTKQGLHLDHLDDHCDH